MCRVSTLTLAQAGKAPHGSISANSTAYADSHRIHCQQDSWNPSNSIPITEQNQVERLRMSQHTAASSKSHATQGHYPCHTLFQKSLPLHFTSATEYMQKDYSHKQLCIPFLHACINSRIHPMQFVLFLQASRHHAADVGLPSLDCPQVCTAKAPIYCCLSCIHAFAPVSTAQVVHTHHEPEY